LTPSAPLAGASRFRRIALIRDAFAVRERLGDPRLVPGFRCSFRPGMPSSTTPGTSTSTVPDNDVDIAFAERSPARHSQYPRNPFHARRPFRGFHSSHIRYGLPVCSPPCTDPTSFLAVGDFYIQASGVSVTLPAAGYDYNSDWTLLLAGLSPAGMTASLAARSLRSPSSSPVLLTL